MKNVAINEKARAQLETVHPAEVGDAMQTGSEYSQEQVCDLLPNRPRCSVRDALHKLIEQGLVWRTVGRDKRVSYRKLEGDELQTAIERKTFQAPTPAWMQGALTNYGQSFRQIAEPTRWRV